MNLHAKFDVYSSNPFRDMEGSQNFKSRSRDSLTTCKWVVASDPILGFLNPDLLMHYITFSELRWQLKVVYIWASPLFRPFLARFWSKIGWLTWPVNRRTSATRYLNSVTPTCLFTIHLSLGNDLRVVTGEHHWVTINQSVNQSIVDLYSAYTQSL